MKLMEGIHKLRMALEGGNFVDIMENAQETLKKFSVNSGIDLPELRVIIRLPKFLKS